MKDEIKKLRQSKIEADRRKALSLLEAYLKENPLDAEAWYDKAGCHDFIGEEKEAEPCYQKTYELGWRKLPDAEQPSFFVGFGSTLRNNFHFDRSIEVLQEGVSCFPDDAAIKIFLAFSFYSKRQDREAAQTLFTAITQSSKKGLNGYERAVQWYVDNLETHPESRN